MQNTKLKKWKLISSEIIHSSKWLTLKNNSYEINGKLHNKYYNIDRPNYSIIIAEDKDKNIIIIKQYRRGANDFFYELPAGMIDDNEDPVTAAERELQEETGYFGKGKLLGKLFAQPVFTPTKAYVVYIKIEGRQEIKNPSEDEIVEVYKFKIDQIRKMIAAGEITCMGTVSAISLYLSIKEGVSE